MKLVIVESPTKAKTLSHFLGKGYKVESSFGHVRDLPKSKLGIDVENNFEPHYIIPMKAKKKVTALKKEAQKSDLVILATDEDREGEAIAWHLSEALGLGIPSSDIRKPKQISLSKSSRNAADPPISASADTKRAPGRIPKVQRIVFHEITKRAIEEAIKNPRKIDANMVDAQQGRRILDRLVGYKLSPFLWKKVMGGLSAGRVQSVALRLIVDREEEIRAFRPQEYWSIEALLQSLRLTRSAPKSEADTAFTAQLAKIGGKTIDKFGIKNREEAEAIAEDLKNCSLRVSNIEKKEVKKNPLPPFTTSTLQQESAKRLRYTAKKTMFLAQRLYENGLITYMRTDSVNLSQEATIAAKKWLEENLGSQYAAEAPRAFAAKSKLAQEAHEAIRPTSADLVPHTIGGQASSAPPSDEQKLYELIWRRFVASQMPHARIASTTIEIRAQLRSEARNQKQYGLRATGQQIIFDGYIKIWQQKFAERELPLLVENEELTLEKLTPLQHFTEPPPRYTEATLVKTLEEYGIGRPSTYAPTISVIQTRNYVIKEAAQFKPTEIGELVHKVIKEHFPEIVDIGFTAQMENELDEIAKGRISWQGVIHEFYGPFAKTLAKKYEEVAKENLVTETTDEICEKCGKPMIVKMGRFGKFLACSGFPECKTTKKLEGANAKEPPKSTGLKCQACGEGEIVERRVSRGRARGKIFWGCSRYPKCDSATWENPLEPPEETRKSKAAKQSTP